MDPICIFDLDGTLVDSMPRYTAGMYKVLDEDGIPYEPDLIKILTPLGYVKSAEYYIRQLGAKGTVESIVRRMEENLKYEYENNIRLKPGVEDYLKQRKAEGARLFVLTASPHIVTDICLKNNGVYDLFEKIWSVEDFGLSKSGTELFYKVAETLDCKTEDVEFFDDNRTALMNAKASGMRCYAVADRQTDEDLRRIREIGDVFVPGFDQPFEAASKDRKGTVCRVCGKIAPLGVSFCPKCGQKIISDEERAAIKQEQEERGRAIRNRNKKILLWVGAVVALIAIVLGIGLPLYNSQFAARGYWTVDQGFYMESASIQINPLKDRYNVTDELSGAMGSGYIIDAAVSNGNYSVSMVIVMHTTKVFRNEDGTPFTEDDMIDHLMETTDMNYHRRITEGDSPDKPYIFNWKHNGLPYRGSYTKLYSRHQGMVLVRKVKESFIIILSVVEDQGYSNGSWGPIQWQLDIIKEYENQESKEKQ